MTFVVNLRRLLPLLLALIFATGAAAQAQPAQQEYQPQVGQAGKDVVWVPSPNVMVEKMLDLARLTPQDYLIDLGSGDGRTVIAAARRGARAHGIEYDPHLVELSKRTAAEAGVSDRATFARADLFASNFFKATVITMFLLPEINLKLRPRLLDLTAGTRIVSNTFTMGDWQADETASASVDCAGWCTVMLWIVPAKAEGTWRWAEGELTLKQKFQTVSGRLKNAAGTLPVTGRLRGDQIAFAARGAEYTAKISGARMEGFARASGQDSKFSASRISQ
jgi:hypothetical protein